MADYTHNTKTVRQERWELKTPTNGVELNKAVSAAAQAFRTIMGRGIEFDDDLSISIEGDTLVIWFGTTP